MDSNVVNMKSYDGPCRETAQTMLARKISELRRRADGLEALQKALDAMEPGSPAEEALWDVLGSAQAFHRSF
jgi:hypothetical protein